MANDQPNYDPSSLLITIPSKFNVMGDDGVFAKQVSQHGYAVIFHEYTHWVHSISTISGIARFRKQIELWNLFRLTINSESGLSDGSESQCDVNKEKIKELCCYFRRINSKSNPESTVIKPIKITGCSLDLCDKTGISEILLEMVSGSGTDGETRLKSSFGVQEILEGAARSLEEMIGAGLPTNDTELYTGETVSEYSAQPPAFFPYRVAETFAKHVFPDISQEHVLLCLLSALQSTDPAKAFYDALILAKQAQQAGECLKKKIGDFALELIKKNAAEVLTGINNFTEIFNLRNEIAAGVEHIGREISKAIVLRLCDPFFEKTHVEGFCENQGHFFIPEIPACMVLDKRGDDELDILIAFTPEKQDGTDIEVSVRVLHCAFHFMWSHLGEDQFIDTGNITNNSKGKTCPFFTSCDLELTKSCKSGVCKTEPWKSAEWWKDKNSDHACWYATAVKLTGPPP